MLRLNYTETERHVMSRIKVCYDAKW